MRNIKNTGLAISVAFMTVFLFASCDLFTPGLGEKVDITPPVLKIDPLSVDNTIPYRKGVITLGGSISDDLSTPSITVTYNSFIGSKTVAATMSNKAWSVAIASGLSSGDAGYDDSIKDGEQQFIIRALDSSGKTAEVTATIYVDNKPPTVMLTSPTTYNNTTISAASQWTDSIEIKGQAYDRWAPITQIRVQIIDADGTGLVLAQGDAEGTTDWNIRFLLKGSAIDSLLTDGESYRINVIAADKTGNTSSHYFHRKDLNLLKSAGVLFPPMDEIGKLEQDSTAVDPSTSGLTRLELGTTSNQLGTSLFSTGGTVTGTYANFVYSADALPIFSVAGFEVTNTAIQNKKGLGEPISGNIQPPPSSGDAIEVSTFRAEFWTPIGSSAERIISTSVNSGDLTYSIVGSNSLSFTLKTGALAAGEYILKIFGGTLSVSGHVEYSFFIDSNAPTLTETGIGTGVVLKNSVFSFAGSAASAIGLSKIEIEQSKDGGPFSVVQTINYTTETNSAYNSNNFPLPVTDGSYSYNVILTSKSGTTSTLSRSVVYDTTAPVVAVSQLTPVVDPDTYNGKVRLSIAGSDANGMTGVRYWVLPNGDPAPVWADAGSTEDLLPPYGNTALDSSAYANATYNLWVVGRDKAGNDAIVSQTMIINQSADDPVFASLNMNSAVNSSLTLDAALLTPAGKVTQLHGENGSDVIIQGTISDDDMINGASLKYRVDDDSGAFTALSTLPGNGKTVNFSHTITGAGATEGKHRIYLQVSDLAAEKNTNPAVTKTIGPIWYAVDYSAPVLTETVINTGNTQYTKTNLVFSGKSSDTFGTPGLSVKINGGTATAITIDTDGDDNIAGNADDNSWSYTLDVDTDGAGADTGLAEGSYSVVFTATDLASQSTAVTRTVVVDTTIPSAAITAIAGYQSGTIPIGGTAIDGGSGVASIEYQLGGTGGSWIAASGSSSWTGSLDLSASAEGSITLYVRSTDRAGNISANATTAISVDRSTPRATATGTTALIQTNSDYIFSGLADDASVTAGRTATATITWSKDGGSDTIVPLTPVLDADGPDNIAGNADDGLYYSWTLATGAAVNDGLYAIKLTVTDVASKQLVVNRTVQVDKTGPTVVIAAPLASESTNSSTYSISGTSRDTGGVGFDTTLDVEYSLNGGGWTGMTLTGTNWTVANLALGASEGAKTLAVRSTDKLGNVTVVPTVTFYYDLANPTLTETTVSTTDTKYQNANLAYAGKASDSNALSTLTVASALLNGGTPVAITVDADGADNIGGNADDNSWSYTADVDTDGAGADTGLAAGTHVLTFTATDAATKTTTVTRTIMVDATAPSLSGISDRTASWNGSQSISFSGTASDAGSGLVTVEYRLSADGIFDGSPVTENDWNTFTGTTAFSAAVSVADGATNKIQIRSVDRAGNTSTPVVGNLSEQTVRVDTTIPSGSFTLPVVNAKMNGQSNVTVTVSALDNASGVASVTAKPGDTSYDSGGTALALSGGTSLNGTWTANIPAANIALLADGSRTLYLRIRDSAGKDYTTSTSVFIDKTAPNNVAFTTPSASSTVNKLIDIKGTAEDNAALGSISLHILGSDLSTWTSLGIPALSANWTLANFNTQTYGVAAYDISGTAGIQIRLRVTATDEAGNVTQVNHDLTVDQASDRPVVKLSNLRAVNDTLKLTKTLYGSLTDDDGAPATVKVKSFLADSYATITLDGGSFTYDVVGTDGTKELYFEVTDAKGTTFVSSAAATLDQPLFQYVDLSMITQSVNGTFAFKLDTINPDVASDVLIDITPSTAFDNAVQFAAGTSLGGTDTGASGKFVIRIEAKDANGISSVKVDVNGKEKLSPTIDKILTRNFAVNGGATPINSGYAVWDSPSALATDYVDVTDFADGNATVVVTVTDGSQLKTTVTKNIIIDNTAASIGVISPLALTVVNGDVTINGFTSDPGTTSSGVQTVEYKVGSGAWTNTSGGVYAWQLPFTGANSINNYATATYATDDGSDIWTFPIQLRVTDKAGNIATKSDYSVKIDPSGDKPKVTISYPYDPAAALGGQVRVAGSATDNNGVWKVFMQIDANNNSDYTDDTNVGGINWYAGGIGQEVTGQNNWYRTINTGGEFNPLVGQTKTIKLRVRSQDTKNGTSGDIYGPWVETSIIFDDKVPRIGSTTPLFLDNGTTQLPFTPGMAIKGNWTLKGSIETDNALSDIQLTGGITGTLAANAAWFNLVTPAEATWPGKYKRIDLQVPITTTADDAYTLTLTVKAFDSQAQPAKTEQEVRLSVDNKAPAAIYGSLVKNGSGTLSTTTRLVDSSLIGNASVLVGQNIMVNGIVTQITNFASASGTVDFTDPVTGSSAVYSIVSANTPIINSNGSFKISGVAQDSGTDTKNIMVYIVRRDRNAVHTNDRFYSAKIGGANNTRVNWSAGNTATFNNGSFDYPSDANAAFRIDINNKSERGIGDADNDLYIENLEQKLGSSYLWSIDLDSTKIPDGPIEIHYVVYDDAGNSTHSQVNTAIQNSGPVVTVMNLGTDLDGSGAVNKLNDEYVSYALTLGGGQYNNAATGFIVKSSPMLINPDVTGGNGDLAYRVMYGSTEVKKGALRVSGVTSDIQLITGDFTTMGVDDTATFARNLIVEVWDTTEETRNFTTDAATPAVWNSLNVKPWVGMSFSTGDFVSPKSVISPFFWTSEAVNSLYNGLRTNGHIELTGVVDGTDPDVSGTVSFKGTVYDDKRITGLYMYIDSFTFTDTPVLATKNTFGDGRTYAKVASFSSGVWTVNEDFASSGWNLTITPDYIGQTGHKVSWQLDWDSAKITTVAALNRNLRIVAEDAKTGTANFSATSAGGTLGDDASYNVPAYGFDVVPYVSGITRQAPLLTRRSKYGKYPVSVVNYPANAATTLTVTGFNLKPGHDAANDFVKIANSPSAALVQSNTNASDSFALPATAAPWNSVVVTVAAVHTHSGWLRMKVNNIEIPNNINVNTLDSNKDNDGSGFTASKWNDDRYIILFNTGDMMNSSANPQHVAMSQGTNGALYGSWIDYSNSDVYYGRPVSNGNSRTSILHLFDPPEFTDIYMTGTNVNMAYVSNAKGGDAWAGSSVGNVGSYSSDGSMPTWNGGGGITPGSGDSVAGDYWMFDRLDLNEQLWQFHRPRVARSGNNLHTAWYDSKDSALKYGYQATTDNTADMRNWLNLDGGSDTDDSSYGNAIVPTNTTRYVQTVSGYGTFTRSTSAGEYFAMDVDEDGLPVIVYYDTTSAMLRLARANSATPTAATNWIIQPVFQSTDTNRDYSGNYLAIKFDATGNLYIVTGNSGSGSLIYLTAPNVEGGTVNYAFGTSTVLDEDVGGTWSDISLNGTTPYISYLRGAGLNTTNGMKIAFWDASITDADKWETFIMPTNNLVKDQRTNIEYKNGGALPWMVAVGYKSANLAVDYWMPIE